MEDKEQIIIDGVDVSKCKNYRDEDVYSYEDEEFINGCCEASAVLDSYGELMCYRPCKEQDCYYKQLARKIQECEELKEKLAAQENINNHIADYQVTTSKISDRYRKALEKIEHYFEQPCEACYPSNKCQKCIETEILDIIYKVKEEE